MRYKIGSCVFKLGRCVRDAVCAERKPFFGLSSLVTGNGRDWDKGRFSGPLQIAT